jgi:hypothetical protein
LEKPIKIKRKNVEKLPKLEAREGLANKIIKKQIERRKKQNPDQEESVSEEDVNEVPKSRPVCEIEEDAYGLESE